MAKRVYKTIPKGRGAAPPVQESDAKFQERMDRIKRISGGMGDNLRPADPVAPVKKRPAAETRKTLPAGSTHQVIKYIFDTQDAGDKMFEDIEGM